MQDTLPSPWDSTQLQLPAPFQVPTPHCLSRPACTLWQTNVRYEGPALTSVWVGSEDHFHSCALGSVGWVVVQITVQLTFPIQPVLLLIPLFHK